MNDAPSNHATLVAANLLDRVLTGGLTPEKALQDWPPFDPKPRALINFAWTALQHFADDADLHAVDADYLVAERSKLQEFASSLRNSSPQRIQKTALHIRQHRAQ